MPPMDQLSPEPWAAPGIRRHLRSQRHAVRDGMGEMGNAGGLPGVPQAVLR